MIVESALDLASKGFRIFPLKPNSKLPAVSAFYDEATTDETKIKNWWKRNPKFNIGISTDEWCVLDVDTKNANGFETLKGKTLPNAFFQVTPTGGRHRSEERRVGKEC